MLGGVPDRLEHGLTVAGSPTSLLSAQALWSNRHEIGTLTP